MMRKLSHEKCFRRRRYHVNPDASRPEVCKTNIVNEVPDYWTLVRACRKGTFKELDNHGICPPLVQRALVDCIADETCGAVRVALQDLPKKFLPVR